MKKYRMRPVKSGRGMRMSFSTEKRVLDMPNLIEVQKNSYQWFLDEGLREVFKDISPIVDYTGNLSLELVDYQLCKEDIKYSIEECKERDATYAAPIKVNVHLRNEETGEIAQHDIFMGDLPLMTETGTFVINGAERVIVSQLVRSPGIYYAIDHDKFGKTLYSSTVIPNRGAWLEYETDSNDVFYVHVDRNRKVPITVLIRALGFGTNQEIIDLFGEEPKIMASLEKDVSNSFETGVIELYKRLRPGEPEEVENATNLFMGMFFDARRYDLAKVGRYKYNKKLALKNRIAGHVLAEDVIDPSTGEVLFAAGTTLTREDATAIQNAAVPFVYIQTEEKNVKVLSNLMVDLSEYVGFDPKEVGIHEAVYYPVLEKLLQEYDDEDELKAAIEANVSELVPKHITKEDILAFEKEVLGVYVSGHPLDEYAAMWKKHISAMSTDFEIDDETGEPKVKVDSKATIGGMIMAKSVKPTKTGQLMAYLTIEDLVGTVEVIVFPRTFSTYRNIIEGTDKLFITGRVNANADENAKLICESVVPFEDVPRKLWIRFASEEEYLKKASDLAEELKYSDGKDSIIIYCTKENKRIALPQSRNIRITPDILASLRAQYGIKNVETT